MRQLRRPEVCLPTLSGEGPGARAAEEHRAIKEANPEAPLKFKAHWTRPDVLGALYAMQGRNCAYCQAELSRGGPGAVDHFRPMNTVAGSNHSGYWWLAYDFRNYLLACGKCNDRSVKGNRFPLPPGATRVEYSTRATLMEEPRLLCDPTVDPVEDWLRVDWIDPLCCIAPLPSLEDDSVAKARAHHTIEFFHLNLDPRLRQQRVRLIGKATKLLMEINQVGLLEEEKEEKKDKLRRLASRFHPHGIVVRSFLIDHDPSLLPTACEELHWLIDQFFEELESARETLQQKPTNPRPSEKVIGEVCWALAILWRYPPAGRPEDIERRLIEAKWMNEVRRHFDQLRDLIGT